MPKHFKKSSTARPRNVEDESIAQRYISLAERAAKTGFWSWSVSKGEIYWSEGMFSLFGLDSTKDIPSFDKWRLCLHPEDRDKAEAATMESRNNGSYLFNQYRIVLPDGQIRWIEAYGDLTYDADGEVERMSGLCVDATKRIQLEAEKQLLGSDLALTLKLKDELRRSQEQLELALSGSGLALWDWAIPEQHVSCCERWQSILGYSSTKLGHREEDWLALIHPSDVDKFRNCMRKCLNGDDAIFECEQRLRHIDGHWVHLLARGKVSHRVDDGTPVRVVGTVQDVTLRNKLSYEGFDLLNKIASLIEETTSNQPGMVKKQDVSAMLTRRQRQTLVMISQGLTSSEIARQLNISTGTAIGHRRELMKKFGLRNAAEVTRFAVEHDIGP